MTVPDLTSERDYLESLDQREREYLESVPADEAEAGAADDPRESSPSPNFKYIAEKMIALGWHVVPTPTGEKRPVLPDWPNLATRDLAQVSKWADTDPHANCACVAKPDGNWVFDDDRDVVAEYESIHGPIDTYRVRTISGGTQLHFKQNAASLEMGNIGGKDADGETWSARVHNRVGLAPGSVAHPRNDKSQPLTWYRASNPGAGVIEAPQSFIEFLLASAPAKATPGEPVCVEELAALVARISAAADERGLKLRIMPNNGGFKTRVCCPCGQPHRDKRGSAVLFINADGSLVYHASCAWRWEDFAAWLGIETAAGEDSFLHRPYTHLGNAERLVDMFGDSIRFCDSHVGWLTWDEQRWIECGTTGPLTLMQTVVRQLFSEAKSITDMDLKERLLKFARTSESDPGTRGAINQARGLKQIRAKIRDFDSDPFLLNLLNGTYELAKGKHFLRKHRRGDLITKLAPVNYDPDAKCPLWEEFLRKCVPDADTRRLLQQASGYTLTGNAKEDCLFLNIGTGRNGKGTFLNTIRKLLGDYAMQAAFSSFAANKGSGLAIRGDIARLAGSRMVVSSENEEDQRLAEALLKTLTGGDAITARQIYEKDAEYVPQFKLWFMVNNEPRITGRDEGIWSRIYFIPWNVYLKSEERNKSLRDDLVNHEAAGILNWMLDGLKDYQKHGLIKSAEMDAGYTAFKEKCDQIAKYIDERCTLEATAQIASSRLYEDYSSWATTNKEFQLRQPAFNKALENLGYQKELTNKGKVWTGIGIKTSFPFGGGR